MESTDQPLVSVAMPCYNAARFLEETLRGVLAQSHADLEVVVVDDGSTDDPAAIVRAVGDPRVRLFSQPPSGGPSRPRNRAVAEARGRYVFFCDADDVMRPGKIAAQLALLEARPDVALVFTNFAVIDDAGAVVEPDFLAEYESLWSVCRAAPGEAVVPPRRDLYHALLRANFIGTSSVAVRRSVLDEVGGFDEGLASSEDNDLWLRILRRHPCGFVNVVGHAYRRHPASVMHQVDAKHPRARIAVLEKHLPGLDDPVTARIVRRRLAENHVAVGYALQLAGDIVGARRSYGRAWRTAPSAKAGLAFLKCLLAAPLLRARHRAAD